MAGEGGFRCWHGVLNLVSVVVVRIFRFRFFFSFLSLYLFVASLVEPSWVEWRAGDDEVEVSSQSLGTLRSTMQVSVLLALPPPPPHLTLVP